MMQTSRYLNLPTSIHVLSMQSSDVPMGALKYLHPKKLAK